MAIDWGDVLDRVGDGINRTLESASRGLAKLVGNSNDRQVNRLRPQVARINALEPKYAALSDAELAGTAERLRARMAAGETMEQLLPDSFAAVRESGQRFMRMRHYDVQLLGGVVLHNGRIAEMVTGEGKTLVATLPAFLNALPGLGVHIITVNDYLARRDAEWMSPLFTGLGMTVGAIQAPMSPWERLPVYACDITYGTASEFGFDYLRDNMKHSRAEQCQKKLNYAIIDEVDSILIDEARTPLIIAGSAVDDPAVYKRAHQIAMQLRRDEHFEVKEKEHTCHLTDAGNLEAEKLAGVDTFYTPGNMQWPHLLDNALKAIHLYRRDKEYIVEGGKIVIVDQNTGRKMAGRHWSDGLHQAVEAKEAVQIQEETQTVATVTFQNFFRLYGKISGMTGTAMTEAAEFHKIYKLDVLAIPTNKPLRRVNHQDVIYGSERDKWKAVLDEVKLVHRTGRPILVGTTSVEKSEKLAAMFDRAGIAHEVLNAKFVERESEIVAQAGKRGGVTIATNMAGRGTDILLGGNPEIQAWAQLKHQYPTRLEVPRDVWRATVEPLEGPMREDGNVIRQVPPTIELAKQVKGLADPERCAKLVDEATERERREPFDLAEKHGFAEEDAKKFVELVDLYEAARPGGLHIVGTERHDSRRIDNQLRGRSGRQGDPGSSRFFLSLDDDLLRIFMGEWVRGLLHRMGLKDGERIESRMVSSRIAGAQKKREESYFEQRKHLLEMDEIMDTQRRRLYGYRQDILEGASTRHLVLKIVDQEIDTAVGEFLDPNYGRKAFAAVAGKTAAVKFDHRDFARCDFRRAEAVAREIALREAQAKIVEAVDENLPEDAEDQSEWTWDSLARQVKVAWEVQVSTAELRKRGRKDIGAFLYSLVRPKIEALSFEDSQELFDEDFGLREAVAWFNHKTRSALKVEELPAEARQTAPALAAAFQKAARAAYVQREVELPVHSAVQRFLPDKSNDPNSRYDREGLVEWAQARFGQPLDMNEWREFSRTQARERLLAISSAFHAGGAVFDAIDRELATAFPHAHIPQPVDQLAGLSAWAEKHLGATLEFPGRTATVEDARRRLCMAADERTRPELRTVETQVLLQVLDMSWKDHLYAMDHLKAGINLRSYAQLDSKVEYKREGRQLFEEMWNAVHAHAAGILFRVEEQFDTAGLAQHSVYRDMRTVHESAPPPDFAAGSAEQQDLANAGTQGERKAEPIRHKGPKVGRNDPCPCGSGKKYKNCHMKAGGGQAA